MNRRLRRLLRLPMLSVVVVVYRMPEQAERTLHSLSARYQRDVDPRDYEIVVVENESDRPLGAERAIRAGSNVRYYRRQESLPTPVNAVNFGAARARGTHLAVVVDGARMFSPSVLRLTLDVLRADPDGVVALTGYHLGHRPQQEAVDAGDYGTDQEAALLASIGWPDDGYRLFEIAALGASASEGYLLPLPESNYLVMPRRTWRAIGGMDTRYDTHGGGYANIDLYKRVLEYGGARCYLLFGEGCFHQYHGGVTTGTRAAERARIYAEIEAQDGVIRGAQRERPQNPPILFGPLHAAAYRFLEHSLARAIAVQSSRQPQREK